MSLKHQVVAVMSAGAALLLALPAAAVEETQELTGIIESSVAASLSEPSVTETLVVGENTVDAGTLTVDANVLTTVEVSFDQTAMTLWEDDAYGTESLGAPLVLAALDSDGVSLGTASSATGGTLVGTSLLGQTVFGLEYQQLVATTDAPGTYRIETTFTVSGGL